MNPAHSGILTLSDGEHTITAPLADAIEAFDEGLVQRVGMPPTALLPRSHTFPTVIPRAGDTISLSFSAVVTHSAIGIDWGSLPAPHFTVVATCARTPPSIGALRAWARRTSTTPWRSRSIASWRSAWRKVCGLTTITIEDVEFVEDAGLIRVTSRDDIPALVGIQPPP